MSGYKATVRQPPMFGVLDVGDDLQELTGEEVRVYREEEARELEARANIEQSIGSIRADLFAVRDEFLDYKGTIPDVLAMFHLFIEANDKCGCMIAEHWRPNAPDDLTYCVGYGRTWREAVRDFRLKMEKANRTPDSDAMNDDEVRAWLRERGRRICEDTPDHTIYRLEGRGLGGRLPIEVQSLTKADDSRGWRALARKVWEREQS